MIKGGNEQNNNLNGKGDLIVLNQVSIAMLSRVVNNTSCYSLDNGNMLREVTVKIGLERIDTQEEVTVKALLDSGVTGLVMSSEFARKQGFKLKKIEKSIYMRNVDESFNKEGPIEHMVEVNIYYQRHRERTEIDVIGEQKWSVILEMPWLACHNLEINWRTEKLKMTRCSEECGKQQRPKQGKLGWQKQKKRRKEERKRKEARREGTEKGKTKQEKDSGCKKDSRKVGNME